MDRKLRHRSSVDVLNAVFDVPSDVEQSSDDLEVSSDDGDSLEQSDVRADATAAADIQPVTHSNDELSEASSTLPISKYELYKRSFIVRSLFNFDFNYQ